MPVRNGTQYIKGLKSRPRDIWIGGQRCCDPTTHPGLSASVEQVARIYDTQVDPETVDQVTYVVPETNQRAGMAFMPATAPEDLVKRRQAFKIWAEMTFGLMGRSPDFLNVSLLAFWEARDVFARGGKRYADNVVKYYEYVRDNDLFLSHALIPPQNDRSKSSGELKNLHMRVTRETDDGIFVSGARNIATLGPISDELLMYPLPGLKPGDQDHALVFAIPTDVKGLRQICREPYVTKGARNSFDHPLSSRFEENDSLLVFNDVFVPWERVFCYRDVALCNAIYPDTALRNHTAHQTNTRALVKMQFAAGVAIQIARSIKADQFLHVQQMLGECVNSVEIIKSGLVRAEVECERSKVGTFRPSLAPLQTLRTFLPRAYPRVVEIIQTIAAGGFMMMPSGSSFNAPEIADDMDLYYQGANLNSIDRVRLFKLGWDLTGEAFGTRALQYERYYAGDPVRTMAGNYLSVDDREMTRLVDAALALAGDPQSSDAVLAHLA